MTYVSPYEYIILAYMILYLPSEGETKEPRKKLMVDIV